MISNYAKYTIEQIEELCSMIEENEKHMPVSDDKTFLLAKMNKFRMDCHLILHVTSGKNGTDITI